MSDDPETRRQIAALAADDRPLLVLDVDDVVLEFIRPFPRFLESMGYRLKLDSFRLHGNVVAVDSGRPAEPATVTELMDAFFSSQADWQMPTEGAAEALAAFDGPAEIVMLTAMPHRHHAVRRGHLEALGLCHPLVTTEAAKGPALKALRGAHPRPVAFVDDIPRNLISARETVADAHLFHLMADNSLRALLPPFEAAGITTVESWPEAQPKIARALGL
ncbi:hypothetical protein N1F89_00815 [Aquibium sp. A9E412]|uniref:hypothetical protein n=1 Tax=Aquibium sp. A9E412 TaxID=2976767 RepID=UPI0025AFAB2E|nr:hypothetical protein [Aquibium sp. A9E412]MDN2564753.1 hypothetical protein [Aquibium sp. A9E412]